VRLRAGGCKGMEYDFEITNRPDKFDSLSEEDGVKIVIDKKSEVLLANATLDYETTLMNSRFVLNFEDSRAKCSCGTSFAL